VHPRCVAGREPEANRAVMSDLRLRASTDRFQCVGREHTMLDQAGRDLHGRADLRIEAVKAAHPVMGRVSDRLDGSAWMVDVYDAAGRRAHPDRRGAGLTKRAA